MNKPQLLDLLSKGMLLAALALLGLGGWLYWQERREAALDQIPAFEIVEPRKTLFGAVGGSKVKTSFTVKNISSDRVVRVVGVEYG